MTVTLTRDATTPATPADVTGAYVGWRKAHPPASDSDRQYSEVVNASIAEGVLEVRTDMRPGFGGWSCQGEPTALLDIPVRYVRILYSDETVFRTCS